MTEKALPEGAAELDRLARDHYVGARTRSNEHDLCAGRWTTIGRALSVSSAVFAAAGGAAIFAEGPLKIVGGVLALVAAVIAAVNTALASSEQVSSHKKARDAFAQLASTIAFFYRVQVKSTDSLEKLQSEYSKILTERTTVASDSPRVPKWAKRAIAAATNRAPK